ncbi:MULTISPECIES: carboxymuconolactone decarboxylase [unclassified Leifsonia]|uniref:carboxymuconolactone decarboxylase family protein n=1 Tax=unclassified Leifsonia TaxID=2663824 RepID=UPI000A18A638|nr:MULTISPECIES: carboxymuconolactone decarboxylase [unclassified Leifsonia]QIZ99216.1 carboxymuconolactone decarboxylase family protein [Leifsonia sp. PS1209]
MSIISTTAPEDAEGEVAAIYAKEEADLGYVASHTRAMAVNPEAYRAWEQLVRSIVSQLGTRRFELVTLAAAQGTHSEHCRLAHGRKTLPLIEEDQLIRIARDYHDADLTEAEVGMMEYAERVSRDSYAMTDADSQRLRDLGFSDREIVDITLAASARNYFSRAIQALAVDVDVPPGLSPHLRGALLAPL